MNNIPVVPTKARQNMVKRWQNDTANELLDLLVIFERQKRVFTSGIYDSLYTGPQGRIKYRAVLLDYELKIHTLRQIIWQRSQAETRSARLHAAEYQDYLDTMNDVRYAGCL